MRWKINFDKRAKKEFKSLPRISQKRVESYFARAFSRYSDPRNFGAPFAYDRFRLWHYQIDALHLVCHIREVERELNILKLSKKEKRLYL